MLNVLVGSQDCSGCPFMRRDSIRILEKVCHLRDRFVTGHTERPDWCPLPVLVSTGTSDLLDTMNAVMAEIRSSREKWPAMHSAHEGYAIILEELDELWQHVKTNQKHRNLPEMKKEAIQLAAMAISFAAEVCNEERGRR